MNVKTLLSILLTIFIVGTLLFVAIFFGFHKPAQDNSVFTKVVTHDHNIL